MGVCSMCTGMQSGHAFGQDAGRYKSCCINRSNSRAVESAYSQQQGLMDLLLGMMWIFPSIIICVFVVVVSRCVHASIARAIQEVNFLIIRRR
jgi:hypothetical protein